MTDESNLTSMQKQELNCKRKRTFLSKKPARQAGKRLRNRLYGCRRSKTRPYQCPICGNWHLTKQKASIE